MKKARNKILTIFIAILLVASLTFVVINNNDLIVKASSTVPSDMLQYETPMYGVDPEGTCFTEGPAPNEPNIKWRAQLPGIADFPIAFGGLVFAQVPYVATYAFDGGTGDLVWSVMGASGSVMKIDDTYMAIGASCYEIATGTKVWDGPPGFAASKSTNGAGYVAELKMFIDYNYGWNLPDPTKPPTLAWNRTLEYNVGHGFIDAYGDGKIFVGGEDGFMRGIDAKTGQVVWESPTTSTAQNYGGVYIDGKIIHGGLDNNMHCWDAETGELLWTYNPGTWYGQWASDAGAAYGMIYEHNQDNYLYAINAETGQMVWRQKGPGIGYSGCLVIADGKVYSPMGERQYRDFATGEWAYSEYNCYDAYTGELIWTLPLETAAAYEAHECIAYGNLYIIPVPGTPQVGGEWAYGTQRPSLGELWCISSEVKDWSMFMADPEHSAEGAGPTNLALKWKFQAEAQIISQPAVSKGVVYFGSLDGNIYALDSETGTKRWEFKTGYQVASSVAVVNGRLYTGADDGNIYCLDASTGAKIWETYAGGVTKNMLGSGTYLNIAPPVRSSPMIVGEKLYVGSLDGNLYCLNINNGNEVWVFPTEGPILATPTIVDEKIYFPSCTGGYPIPLQAPSPYGDFYCLNANSGSIIWHKQIPYVLDRTIFHGNHMHASPTVAEGMVFVRNGFLYTYALNASTGEEIWTYSGRYNPGTASQTGGVIQMGAPLYKYGRIYINDFYGISCINAANGSEIWHTYISRENLDQGLVYSYGRVYTVCEFGVLYVLDAETGDKLSYYEFGTYQMHGAPSLYNGNLYFGLNDWNLYCFGDSRLIEGEPAETGLGTLVPEALLPAQDITEAPLITIEIAVIAAVAVACIIGVSAFLMLRKRK